MINVSCMNSYIVEIKRSLQRDQDGSQITRKDLLSVGKCNSPGGLVYVIISFFMLEETSGTKTFESQS